MDHGCSFSTSSVVSFFILRGSKANCGERITQKMKIITFRRLEVQVLPRCIQESWGDGVGMWRLQWAISRSRSSCLAFGCPQDSVHFQKVNRNKTDRAQLQVFYHYVLQQVLFPSPLPLTGAATQLPPARKWSSLPKGFLLLKEPAWPQAHTLVQKN